MLVNQDILKEAAVYGNMFAFGLLQIPLNKMIPSDWKASFFVVFSTLSTSAAYFALIGDNLVFHVLLAAVSSASAVTGAVNLAKQPKQPTVTVVADPA